VAENIIVKALNDEFTGLYEDTRMLVEFAFPKPEKPLSKSGEKSQLHEAVDLAWGICGLINATSNLSARKGSSITLRGWSAELPANARILLDKLKEAHQNRLKAFKDMKDSDLQKTIMDSEGETTDFAEQMVILLTSGSRLLGRLYSHLQNISDSVPPIV
jgi:hypothetical protein